ncbi:MAG TPA: GreA/GreB family elongation factor [Chloroflexota bacterium]|nr:GreA/GreB family elongation factor [Chloroflexota bacterium]
MPSDLTVGEATRNYIAALKPEERPMVAPELQRFVRWFGPDRRLRELDPIQLERYQEQLTSAGVDPASRLEPLRQFLSDARSKKLLDIALAVHVRVRRKTAAERVDLGSRVDAPTIEVTQAGHDQLQAELQRLESEERPRITADVERAYADKDFRENAPYDAAKQHLAEIQRRINEIRETLTAAKIVGGASGERAGLGTRVVVRDLAEGEEVSYTLVGPGEVDRRSGRISIQSPVGQALADRKVGETVEVQVPAGVIRYRIERIE